MSQVGHRALTHLSVLFQQIFRYFHSVRVLNGESVPGIHPVNVGVGNRVVGYPPSLIRVLLERTFSNGDLGIDQLWAHARVERNGAPLGVQGLNLREGLCDLGVWRVPHVENTEEDHEFLCEDWFFEEEFYFQHVMAWRRACHVPKYATSLTDGIRRESSLWRKCELQAVIIIHHDSRTEFKGEISIASVLELVVLDYDRLE